MDWCIVKLFNECIVYIAKRPNVGRVGFTTIIPIEILFTARRLPVGLDHVFITHPEKKKALVKKVELEGYPRNIYGGIKGIHAVATRRGRDTDFLMNDTFAAGCRRYLEYMPRGWPRS